MIWKNPPLFSSIVTHPFVRMRDLLLLGFLSCLTGVSSFTQPSLLSHARHFSLHRSIASRRGPPLKPAHVRTPCRLHTKTTMLLRQSAAELNAIAQELLAVGELEVGEVNSLIKLGKFGTSKSGAVLVREGQDVTVPLEERNVYLLLSGSAEVTRGGEVVSKLSSGEFIGESRFLEVETLEKLKVIKADFVEETFRSVDLDKSGSISPAELQTTAKARAGIELSLEQAEQIVAAVDSNSDGEVQLEEVKRAVAKMEGKEFIRDMFLMMDKDGSGAIDARELRAALEDKLGVQLNDEQATKLIEILSTGRDQLTLNQVMMLSQKMRESEVLERTFRLFDSDGSGKIDIKELGPLLAALGVQLSKEQVQVLVQSLDLNNDGEMDVQELKSGIARLQGNVVGRFGNVLRLFEAVAFGSQRGSQVSVTVKAGEGEEEAKFISWSIPELLEFFAKNPSTASKVKSIWAIKLAMKLKATTGLLSPSKPSSTPASSQQQQSEEGDPLTPAEGKPADYGYGSNFVYGRYGDLGPLRRAVPANLVRMAVWNFGREYRALRNAFRLGEVRELVNSVSGAGAWFRSKQALSRMLGECTEEERREKLAEIFKSIDKDESGAISVEELRVAIGELGVEATSKQVEGMLKVADQDASKEISLEEFSSLVNSLLKSGDKFDLIMKKKGWLPPPVAKFILFLTSLLGNVDEGVEEALKDNLRPVRGSEVPPEARRLQEKVARLVLDNDAVAKREEIRMEQLKVSLEKALKEEKSPAQQEFVQSLQLTATPALIMVPYTFLCWLIDVLFVNRPIQRFWFLETVARMPYFSYITMLTLYESLGWWRSSMDSRRVHFAEEWNEVQHLKIMEALGGDRSWFDRFMGRHAAIFYFIILNHIWLLSPSLAYNFSELIEFHAVDTYGEFVDANEELLKSLPPPQEAVEYYNSKDLYLFDEFQTGRTPKSRRPVIRSLYDVFCNIRDDELEHVKTMFQCQTSLQQIQSPNAQAAEMERKQEESVEGGMEGWAFPSDEDLKEEEILRKVIELKREELRALEQRL
mmetsp:Transcript_3503/g.12201  ORF Transcript_3503/g.12201 Transcript_3503/m.12201 type:complete len:1039 (-) Transcript_3503:1573-4689(-)